MNHLIYFLKLVFNWRIILYRIVLVSSIHQHESAIGVHMSPPSCTSHLPAHPTPLGCQRAPEPPHINVQLGEGDSYYNVHFTDDDIEVQRGPVT